MSVDSSRTSDSMASPPPDRYCDLVMKGGIASGIVYPTAIERLSEVYRFKNIGGTSVGAVAASVTAAAELQRRTTGSAAGFKTLGAIATEFQGKGKLLSLFQPYPGCQRLFDVLKTALNATTLPRRVGWVAMGAVRGYPLVLVLVAAISVAVWMLFGALPGFETFLIGAICGLLASVAYDVLHHVVDNRYGLCRGAKPTSGASPALMDWLSDKVQRAAGRTVGQPPVTFGDLWSAGGFPPPWIERGPEVPSPHSIELQMFTTNITHGRPYCIPFDRQTHAFYFSPSELAGYLPATELQWMEDHSDPNGRISSSEGLPLWPLPADEHLPILFAARLSLSFPLLFSAVPIWIVPIPRDKHCTILPFTDPPSGLTRCLFSDGGISSNFPVHLFDSYMPLWPTFGLNLIDMPPLARNDHRLPNKELVFHEPRYWKGYDDTIAVFDAARPRFDRLAGYFFGIVGTMQNWSDVTTARMPGVRDRIVKIGLYPDEGGLNLDMQAQAVEDLADRGRIAADLLIEHFHDDSGHPTQGWQDQCWIRMCASYSMSRIRYAECIDALSWKNPYSISYPKLVTRALTTPALPGLDQPLPSACEKDWFLYPLLEAAPNGASTSMPTSSFLAIPKTDLRIRPAI